MSIRRCSDGGITELLRRAVTREQLFQRLVDNALDFLKKAIQELDGHPKHSMISFHTAVELFVKARLMAEHWTLIVARRQEPDWSKFISGDFESVSLDDAAIRLEKVLDSGLSRKELEVFREVTKHRNKTIHFFHEAHTDAEATELRQEIVKQQLTAWYFLHKLVTDKWAAVFQPWSEKIVEIDNELRQLHGFLAVIFNNLADTIAQKKKDGLLFKVCPSCDFDAQMYDSDKDVVYETECLVCGLSDRGLQTDCPDCGTTVIFQGEGFAICSGCGKSFEPDDIVDVIGDDAAMHQAAKDGDDSWDLGNCSYCDGYHTLVRTEDEGYICAGCFGRFEHVTWCEWCNEPNNGDMEHSYWSGCNHCDGKGGWDKD